MIAIAFLAGLVAWLGEGSGPASALDPDHTLSRPQTGGVELDPMPQPEVGSQRSVATVAPVESAGEAPAPEPTKSVTVLAHCVDGKGSPLEHVILTAVDLVEPISAESDSDGRVRLEIPWPMDLARGNPSWIMAEATRDGWTRVALQKRLSGPGTVDLGRAQLVPGGTLVGRVVDSTGAPIAKAFVWVAGASLQGGEKQEEQRRVQAKPFPYIGSNALHTQTDERGHYRIGGVPAREVSAVAQATGLAASYTRPVAVFAGAEAQAGDLILLPMDEKNLIRGIVLSQGQPVRDAEILVFENRGARNINPQARAWSDPETGRFQVPVLSNTPFTLEAKHPTHRGRSIVLHDVSAGTPGVQLVFPQRRYLQITTAGPQGEAIETPTVTMSDEESRMRLSCPNEPLPGGGIRILLPADSFYLSVFANGYRHQQLGPWEPKSMPETLRINMQRATLLSGRVRFQGAPVGGVLVHLHEPPRENAPVALAGMFPTGWSPHSSYLKGVQTDAEGRYELAVRGSGPRLLHAQSQGYALAELGPIDVVEDQSLDGLDFELGQGGILKGRVLLPPEGSTVGIMVAASRGAGHVATTQVGDDGNFQFAHLTPGKWQVAQVDAQQVEWLRQQSTQSLDPKNAETIVTVQIAEGETSEMVLDLIHLVRCTLSGHFSADGSSREAWSVHLFRRSSYANSVVDGDGIYSVSLVEEGPAQFSAWCSWPQGGRTTLSRSVQLKAGSNSLDVSWPAGTLSLTDLPPPAPRHTERQQLGFALVNRDVSGMLWTRTFEHDRGLWHGASVPSGTVELRRREDTRYASPESWPLLMSLDVRTSETTHFRFSSDR